MPNGISISCRIIDVSQSGASIASAGGCQSVRWPARKGPGSVVWSLEDGVLIEFTRLLCADFLEEERYRRLNSQSGFFNRQRVPGATRVIATAAKSRQKRKIVQILLKYFLKLLPKLERGIVQIATINLAALQRLCGKSGLNKTGRGHNEFDFWSPQKAERGRGHRPRVHRGPARLADRKRGTGAFAFHRGW